MTEKAETVGGFALHRARFSYDFDKAVADLPEDAAGGGQGDGAAVGRRRRVGRLDRDGREVRPATDGPRLGGREGPGRGLPEQGGAAGEGPGVPVHPEAAPGRGDDARSCSTRPRRRTRSTACSGTGAAGAGVPRSLTAAKAAGGKPAYVGIARGPAARARGVRPVRAGGGRGPGAETGGTAAGRQVERCESPRARGPWAFPEDAHATAARSPSWPCSPWPGARRFTSNGRSRSTRGGNHPVDLRPAQRAEGQGGGRRPTSRSTSGSCWRRTCRRATRTTSTRTDDEDAGSWPRRRTPRTRR